MRLQGRSRGFAASALCLWLALPARGGFAPMALNSSSFNQDIVVENTAPAPVISGGYTTASMDNGVGNTATSWYEQGYDAAQPATGVPKAGTTFTSQSSSTHSYTMAPSYTANNAVLLDSTVTNAMVTLVTPTVCSQLSFLESGGNNGCSFNYTVYHQSGANDTGSGVIPDWFNGANTAWTANGRIDVGTFALSNVTNNDPRLYSLDMTLGNTASPVTAIKFVYTTGTGHGAIMAVSGATSGAFTPLAITGYNEDMVIEAGAGAPGSLSGFTTATMDTGITNTLNTWYEEGYDPDAPLTGLPLPGSTLTNVSAPDHLYMMPSSYSANNALLLTTNSPTGILTPVTVASYHSLSFLCSAGNGPVTVNYSVKHNNGVLESNSFVVRDWFYYSPVAWLANGRVNVNNKSISDVNAGSPCLYAVDVALQYTAVPVSSVTLTWAAGGGNSTVAFFAMSGGTSTLSLAGNDFNTNSAVAASVLQQWYNASGLYNSTGWWNAANCMEALETVAVADNQLQYLGVLSNTFNLNKSGNFLNGYYDDEGWWANAWIHAYDVTGNASFLGMAKTIFADMTNSWTPATCDGGIWWDKSETYKNAIANELFILTAIRLHERTPGDTGANNYFYWATNGWTWFQNSGMINSKYLINDGLANCVNNNGSTFTYNQGVIVGALTDLFKVTGSSNYLTEATSIAHAVFTNLTVGVSVLDEAPPCNPTCGGGDVPEFKGICIRNIAYLYDVTRDAQCYSNLYNSANAIWLSDRTVFNQLGMSWAGPVDAEDAARQSSALMAVAALAEPMTTNLLFIKGSGDPAFSHPIGKATGALAWTCGPTNAINANYMQTGPHVAYLPTGLHAAHFQIAVDAVSNSSAGLATLSVLEDSNGVVLASAAVPWSAFAQTNIPRDFVVFFTNTVAADPLEFRVLWNNAPGGPDVTVQDVAIDGLVSWSAANLTHGIGQLDGLNAWQADLRSASASGYLSTGPGVEIPPGDYSALFELKVDNFNYDNATVATLSVVNVDAGTTVAFQNLTRSQFPNTRYQTFSLAFNALSGAHYDFRAQWYRSVNAPRLTQRSVILRPGPSAFFTSVQVNNGIAQFTFTGVPGRTYTLQAATTLPQWAPIASVTVPLNLGFAQVTDFQPNTARFYRLGYP